MKSYDETLKSIYEKGESYIAKAKKRVRVFRISTCVLSLCISTGLLAFSLNFQSARQTGTDFITKESAQESIGVTICNTTADSVRIADSTLYSNASFGISSDTSATASVEIYTGSTLNNINTSMVQTTVLMSSTAEESCTETKVTGDYESESATETLQYETTAATTGTFSYTIVAPETNIITSTSITDHGSFEESFFDTTTTTTTNSIIDTVYVTSAGRSSITVTESKVW